MCWRCVVADYSVSIYLMVFSYYTQCMGVTISSQDAQEGDIFICLPGGERYIADALEKGVRQVLRLNRLEAAQFANDYYQNPSVQLNVVGVTGTNGKTTVTWLIHHAINQLGGKSRLQGTLNSRLTTPESPETLGAMASHLKAGGTHFVMEVSSHAIAQKRIEGISFDVRCLTNITHDHLDYHGSFDRYSQVKYSFLNSAMPVNRVDGNVGIHMSVPSNPTLLGAFNIENLKCAKQSLLLLGYDEFEIDAALSRIAGPPGRFQCISKTPLVIVDYAHTPHALDCVLNSARLLLPDEGRLYVVVGCGGNRDIEKRPKMGKISTTSADYAIFTQDNPRFENADAIISHMMSGVSDHSRVTVQPDRQIAIQYGIDQLRPCDGIVIAGKGHESEQCIQGESIPFSDIECVTEILNKK
jgi:UDP-N-acetylmuramoyl-L-alanyl-D-glutamate--2,6-diaminopimelate ligase